MILQIPIRAFYVLLGRQLWRHPLMTFLTAAGVALGVAMVAAIDMASISARDSFAFSTQSVRGSASHSITALPNRIPWQVYLDLRTNLGVRASAPVITEFVTVAELNGLTMTLLGVDPIAEAPYRSFLGEVGGIALGSREAIDFISIPFTLFVDEQTASSHGLAAGDTLELSFAEHSQKFEILAVMSESTSNTGNLPSNLLITDIRDAQDFLDRHGWLDRIDLFFQEHEAAANVEMLQEKLPFSVQIEPASESYDALNQLTKAFRLNLGALSLLAAVVGTFLIYSTLSFNVLKSRPTLGILRALGMSQTQIFALILFEAFVLGLIGSVAGILLGRYLAAGLVEVVNQAYNDIYTVQTLQEVALPFSIIWKAALIGIGCALIGAGMPAYQAAQVEVSHALQNRGVTGESSAAPARNVSLGLIAVLGGAILMHPAFPLSFAFAGIFAGLLGISFFVPLMLRHFMRFGLWLCGSRNFPFARMAMRQPMRRIGQSSVAVAALMMSLSVVIGIGSMVGSFRNSVENWLETVILADIYVFPHSNENSQFLSRVQQQEIGSLPGVAGITTIFETQARSLELGILDLTVLSDDDAKDSRAYSQQMPADSNPWDEAIKRSGLVINEPMSLKHEIKVGDHLSLVTEKSVTKFPVVGVFKSYDAVSSMLMPRDVYLSHWELENNSGAAVTIHEEADLNSLIFDLESYFSSEQLPASLLSNRELRGNALDLFDRTFAVTGTLQILAMAVSFMSVLASLMGMMLDRSAEFITMRAIGVTRWQMGKLLGLESGLFGLSATLLAIPVGLLLSLILVYVINLRSFGWLLDWALQPQEIAKAAAVAAAASTLASIYPIWRVNTNLIASSAR